MTFFSCSILERNTQKVNNFKKMGRKSTVKKRYVDERIKAGYTLKLLVYFQKHGIKNFSMSKMASDITIYLAIILTLVFLTFDEPTLINSP